MLFFLLTPLYVDLCGRLLVLAGETVLGYIKQYESNFFKLEVGQFPAPMVITIEVVPKTGDPDLFVSSRSRNPSEKDFMWRSMGVGADTVTIPPTDPNYPTDLALFVGVHSVSNEDCEFELHATTHRYKDRQKELRWMKVLPPTLHVPQVLAMHSSWCFCLRSRMGCGPF